MEIGDKFGFFEVINKCFKQSNIYITVKCCCGKEITKTEYMYSYRPVRSCGCQKKNRDSSSGNKCKVFKGVGEISKQYYQNLERSAKIRNHEFNIDLEFMWNLFLKQNQKCVFSGEELTFATLRQVKRGMIQSASVDRINNNIGYVASNIQWVHKDANLIRGKMTIQQFMKMVEDIYNFSIANIMPSDTVREPFLIENYNLQPLTKSSKLKIAKWQGIGEIGKTVIGSIERHAKNTNREFAISLPFLWDLFCKQNKRCAYTGQRLYFNDEIVGQTASLDRINSEIGYTEKNVQWIHKNINWAKKDLTTSRFEELVVKIYERGQAGLIPCWPQAN